MAERVGVTPAEIDAALKLATGCLDAARSPQVGFAPIDDISIILGEDIEALRRVIRGAPGYEHLNSIRRLTKATQRIHIVDQSLIESGTKAVIIIDDTYGSLREGKKVFEGVKHCSTGNKQNKYVGMRTSR